MSASILENEILEQPIVLRRLLAQGADQALELISGLRGKFHYILIAARGSSDNAARYAQYLFQIVNQIPVALATPSDGGYRNTQGFGDFFFPVVCLNKFDYGNFCWRKIKF